MRKTLTLACALCSLLSFSQTPYQYEKSTGYTGEDIPSLSLLDNSLNFLVLGDFGRVGDYYQKQVATELGNAMVVTDADFVVSVGDNFYPSGVQSTQDYHWISSFETIYTNPSLYKDWYVALGNHDYQGNIQAQIDYSEVSRRWNMPSTYYSKIFEIDKDNKVLLVVMDTNPFIDSYQGKEKYPQLAHQDPQEQLTWLENTLSNPDTSIKWKIVVGHHPLYSGGKRKNSKDTKDFEADFADFFDQQKVDAYICGHEHDLQIIKPKDRYTTQFLSGAASEVRSSGGSENTIFWASEPGFMSFSVNSNQLVVQVIKALEDGAQNIFTHKISK